MEKFSCRYQAEYKILGTCRTPLSLRGVFMGNVTIGAIVAICDHDGGLSFPNDSLKALLLTLFSLSAWRTR